MTPRLDRLLHIPRHERLETEVEQASHVEVRLARQRGDDRSDRHVNWRLRDEPHRAPHDVCRSEQTLCRGLCDDHRARCVERSPDIARKRGEIEDVGERGFGVSDHQRSAPLFDGYEPHNRARSSDGGKLRRGY